MEGLEEYLQNLESTGATGIIVADPLIIETCKSCAQIRNSFINTTITFKL